MSNLSNHFHTQGVIHICPTCPTISEVKCGTCASVQPVQAYPLLNARIEKRSTYVHIRKELAVWLDWLDGSRERNPLPRTLAMSPHPDLEICFTPFGSRLGRKLVAKWRGA